MHELQLYIIILHFGSIIIIGTLALAWGILLYNYYRGLRLTVCFSDGSCNLHFDVPVENLNIVHFDIILLYTCRELELLLIVELTVASFITCVHTGNLCRYAFQKSEHHGKVYAPASLKSHAYNYA